MRRGLVLILLVLASLSTACSANPVSSIEAETTKLTNSPVKNPKLVLGDTATTTEDGNTLTVLSYESSLSVEDAKPEPGYEFSVIEVEGCAGSSSGEDLMHIGPVAFTLRLSEDGSRVHPVVFDDEDATVKEPALHTTDPPPGSCNRGFVTFQVPQGAKPNLVVFEEEFVLDEPVAWKVPSDQ
ncbi:hypothetical protein BH24ACT22_BH24ACT22_20690 [soil metagenome]